jgi:hypothetical protein
MIIAKEKRRSNIAEYIIYMWNLEEMLRACKFDLDVVKLRLVDGFTADEATLKEALQWYESLIDMMRFENITESGHLQIVKNTINDVYELHVSLLKASNHVDYVKLYIDAKPNIDLFRSKSKNPEANAVEICLNALYSLLLLKLSGKEVSIATVESMDTFSKLMALLSLKYKDLEEEKLELK